MSQPAYFKVFGSAREARHERHRLERHRQARAAPEAQEIDPRVVSVDAAQLTRVPGLAELLDRLGYEPEREPEQVRFALRRTPGRTGPEPEPDTLPALRGWA